MENEVGKSGVCVRFPEDTRYSTSDVLRFQALTEGIQNSMHKNFRETLMKLQSMSSSSATAQLKDIQEKMSKQALLQEVYEPVHSSSRSKQELSRTAMDP